MMKPENFVPILRSLIVPQRPTFTKINNIINQFLTYDTLSAVIDFREIFFLLGQLKSEILRLEQYYSREEILSLLPDLRHKVRESPFLQRAQDWPRGYQGDFETISQILESKNKAPVGTLAYFIEDYFINSPISRQHINKVRHQSQLIAEAVHANQSARILSIGCGTSEDMRMCLQQVKQSNARITLVDLDADALQYSASQLSDIRDQVTLLQGNIYKIMRNLSDQYHLILIGGVFDYLNGKIIMSILHSLKNNVAPQGKIFFTNIDKGNPYRVFMEYLSNWYLHERSEQDLRNLISISDWPPSAVKCLKDGTGLTHMVEINQFDSSER